MKITPLSCSAWAFIFGVCYGVQLHGSMLVHCVKAIMAGSILAFISSDVHVDVAACTIASSVAAFILTDSLLPAPVSLCLAVAAGIWPAFPRLCVGMDDVQC